MYALGSLQRLTYVKTLFRRTWPFVQESGKLRSWNPA
jgi:hypothetical protein